MTRKVHIFKILCPPDERSVLFSLLHRQTFPFTRSLLYSVEPQTHYNQVSRKRTPKLTVEARLLLSISPSLSPLPDYLSPTLLSLFFQPDNFLTRIGFDINYARNFFTANLDVRMVAAFLIRVSFYLFNFPLFIEKSSL